MSAPAPPPLAAPWRRAVAAGAACPLVIALLGLALGGAEPVAAEAGRAAAARVEAGRAYAWLQQLQERFPHRVPGTAAHRDAPAFIAEALREAGAEAIAFERLGRRPLVNLLATIPGRDRSRCVVLAAHYDVVPGAPGAIDDGGAVAVLVEVTRVLAASQPDCDLRIAIFDEEERGLGGSKAHVRALGGEAAQVRAALALELVGWHKDRLVVHTIPYGFCWDAPGIAPAWVPAGVVAGAHAADVPISIGDPRVALWYQGTVRVLGVRTGSDAGAYSEQGIPAAMLTGSSLTNFYESYHQPSDGIAQVEPARLDDAARVTVAAALELAALPETRTPREMGQTYLLVGSRLLGAGWLRAIGLSALLPLVLAAWALGRAGRRARAGQLALLAVFLGLLAGLPSVIGVWVGVPAGVAMALAASVTRGSALLAALGRVVLYVELLLVAGAAASFGFRWRADPLETGALLGFCAILLTARPLLWLLERPRGAGKPGEPGAGPTPEPAA